MQRKKINRIIPIIIVFIFVLSIVSITNVVFAGKSGGEIINESMFYGNDISITEWKYNDSGLSMDNGVIHFDKTYGLSNPLLSRREAKSSEEIEKALTVSMSVQIMEIKGEKEFGFVFGIPRLDKNVGETNSTFLYFANNNSVLCFGIRHFAEEGEIQLLEEKSVNSVNNLFDLEIVGFANGKISVKINNSLIYESNRENETVVSGYLGFSSLGGYTTANNYLDVKVLGCYVQNEYYDKPSTPMISIADFSKDEYNSNEWYVNSSAQDGSGVIATNGVLKFDGAGQNSNFTHKFAYSNFELEYDIFDVNNDVVDLGNGRKKIASCWNGISWGTEGEDAKSVAQSYITENFLYFDADINYPTKDDGNGNIIYDVENPDFGTRIDGTVMRYGTDNGWRSVILPKKYSFFDKGFSDKVRIRLRVIDGVTTLYMKLETEIEYTEIFKYVDKTNSQKTGYINIRGEGNRFTVDYAYFSYCSSYSIDNVTIKNYDNKPDLIKVAYTSNRLDPIPDTEYIDPYTDDYLIVNTKGKPLGK